MKCPRCQHESPTGSSFCLECGARLGLTCGSCGTELPAGSKFCNKCGAPIGGPTVAQPRFATPDAYTPKHLAERILTSKAALEGERKQVTVLFGAPLAHEDHAVLGLGKLDRRIGKREQAQEHLATATAMYREMGMRFWLEQAEAEISEL